MYKIYVDGQHGTTGLLVNERLAKHPEVEILEIPYEERHNRELRTKLLNEADLVFLCLPDEAVADTVSLVTNPDTRIIDASTAN
ncbi:MAG: N-acetyl-gamma-glutamyl-phosphate reductase, partial [Methanolobus sp.]|nr:N-acetyl-gamma-glutamyl-phosphate reductase [Methanolobus sp.]